jgi:hypothetical protein
VEFSLICPNDGRVELSLEDISAVAFRDPESVDVMFTCPQCGHALQVAIHVPNMLMAVLEIARAVEDGEDPETDVAGAASDSTESTRERMARERLQESYCEYFRRQLSHVRCVEDLLAEIDSR